MSGTLKKSKRIIARLSRYKNALYRFRELGFEKVFSDYLAEEVGVTSSQVRKDFSVFNITGNKRAGYQIGELLEHLEAIFRKDEEKEVVLVGAGRLGSALSNYRGFDREGIKIVAAFDIDPSKHQKSSGVPVLPIDQLESYIVENKIEIGLLAVPERVAQETYEKMAKSGVRGVLNFAPIPLKPIEGCLVSTYCVEVELENMIYFVNEAKEADNA